MGDVTAFAVEGHILYVNIVSKNAEISDVILDIYIIQFFYYYYFINYNW